MAKTDNVENKDQKVEKSTKKSVKSSYSNKKKVKKNIINGIAYVKSTFNNNIITTLSYVYNNKPSYSYECLINYAGATLSWLKNNLQIIRNENQINKIFAKTKNTEGVVFVPAFVGLSSPYWKPNSKALIYGLTPSVNKNQIIHWEIKKNN